MIALANKLLAFQLPKLESKNKIQRSNTSYQQAKHIGVLGSIDTPEKIQIINKFVENLEKDGKATSVLCFDKRKEKTDQIPENFKYFTAKDVSLLGKINAPQVNEFIQEKFDFLFHLDEHPDFILTKIMAMSRALCRVGAENGNGKNFYELMIKVQKPAPLEKFSDDMYHYAKILV